MNRKVRTPPGRRILLAATWAAIAIAAVVTNVGVAAQSNNGLRPAPAIVGSEMSWTADIEFESALLVIVGRAENKTVKQITFNSRDALRMDVSRQGLADGRYKYELFLYPPSNRGGNQQVSVRSGAFFVRGGLPSNPEDLDQRPPRTDNPRRGGGH